MSPTTRIIDRDVDWYSNEAERLRQVVRKCHPEDEDTNKDLMRAANSVACALIHLRTMIDGDPRPRGVYVSFPGYQDDEDNS